MVITMQNNAKRTVPEVFPLVRDYCNTPGNKNGGNLHIVLFDGNVGDDNIKFCLRCCEEAGDVRGIELCSELLAMSKTQRYRIYRHVIHNRLEAK